MLEKEREVRLETQQKQIEKRMKTQQAQKKKKAQERAKRQQILKAQAGKVVSTPAPTPAVTLSPRCELCVGLGSPCLCHGECKFPHGDGSCGKGCSLCSLMSEVQRKKAQAVSWVSYEVHHTWWYISHALF